MRAAVLKSPGELNIAEWETPRPKPDEVLVRVTSAGVCAGDLALYQGRNPYAKYPQICGHEICGVVVEGGQSRGLGGGDPVAVEPFLGCGACYTCRIGKPNCCPKLTILGVNRPGGYGEYVVAPAHNVHKVPQGLSLRLASLAEPVAIAVQACRRAAVAKDEIVLVLGCGPIGLACIDVASARGARVMAADLLPDRLEAAAGLGAEVFVANDGMPALVRERAGSDGVPVVIEATGSPKAIGLTMDLVVPGGRIVILGLVKDGMTVTMPGLDFTRKEPTILGSRASVNCFPEALELLASDKIRLPRFVTELPLWDAPKIFAGLAKDATTLQKSILVVS